jgi:hypothetical protein
VSFVGTLTVFVTYPAEEAVYGDGTTIVAPAGALLPVTSGGTGASTAAAARTNLGLGTIATQDANAVAITGGTINGATVGATTVAAGSFTTLNSSGNTRLGGLSGNQSLQVNNVASAINYAQIVGATATNYPAFQAQGTDADVGFLFDAKANGQQYFRSNGGAIQFVVGSKANSVNYMTVTGQTTTNYPVLTASGSDANVGFVFNAKGTADIAFQTNSIRQAQVSYTASAVNYLQLTGAATGAAPTISAQGSDANIPLVLSSKGAGVVALGGSTATNGGFAVAPIASGVNYIIATGAQTGATPKLSSSTANIPVSIQGSNTWANFSNVSAAIGVSTDITNAVGAHVVFGSLNGNAPYVGASNYSTSSNSGLTIQTNGVRQFLAAHTASAVNYIAATGAATTGAPEISAQGSDTNINLKLTPKGTGTLQFGTYTAGVVAQAGYITITDAGGTSRRLLVG